MRKYIIAVFCMLSTALFAQKAKSVVVFGASPAGVAAAIQSAHSGVNTTLIDHSGIDQITLSSADKAYKLGIYADFLKRVDSLQKGKNLSNQNLLPAYTASVFKGWMDTIKNLTVIKRGQPVRKIQRDGKTWVIGFADNSELKAGVIVDASATNEFAAKANAKAPALNLSTGVYPDNIYRTSIAFYTANGVFPSGLPVTSLFAENVPNFIVLRNELSPNILLGQSAGAAAAYCGFFEVENKNLDVRKTQGELITFGSQVLKFDDVSVYDSLAVPIMKIGLTGILKGKVQGDKLMFMPDSTVSTDDIREPMKEYYSRSQIWFLDHKSTAITLEELLSLIRFTANRGKELDKEVSRDWSGRLKLDGKYDLQKPVTRKQFARLVDLYLKPFERTVDQSGKLMR